MKARHLVTFEREDPDADILVITTAWPHADSETYGIPVQRQIEPLTRSGLQSDVLFVRGYHSWLAYVVGAFRLAFWGVAGHRHYRLVHAHGGEAALVATFYRRAPLLVTYLGSDLLGAPRADGTIPWLWRARRACIRQHARLAVRTITESQEMQSVLPASVQRRNTVLPKGVATNLFHPLERMEARRELGWNADARVALFAADPEVPLKRYWLAQAAVEHARTALPDLELKIAHGVTPDRMPLLMGAADCLLHTSASEGSPNVVKEALMCNLPVIATPSGDIAKLLDRVVPSYLCAPTVTAVAGALIECLTEPRRSNGFDISAWLDLETAAASLLRVYQEAAPDLRRPIV